MGDELSNNPDSPPQGGPGQGTPAAKPRPFAVAVVWLLTLMVAVVLVGAAALLTAGRLPASGDPTPADGPSPKARTQGTMPLRQSPPGRDKPAKSDEVVNHLGNVLSYLSRAEVPPDGEQGDDEEEGPSSADIEERLRMARDLAPIFPGRGRVDVPDDLPLADDWRVLFSVPAGASGPDDTLLLVHARGTMESVVEFFRAGSSGWAIELRPPRDDDGSVTMVLRRGMRLRMITVRQRASGDQCVVAILDAPG